MTSPVRISGLVAFGVVLTITLSAMFLLVDTIIGQSIRTGGSELIGAKVELETVDTSLSEQKLVLQSLQVTDPRAPMTNLFEVAKVIVDFDAGALLWNKIVLDELTVTDLALNTPREESGEYKQRWLKSSEWNPMSSVSGFEDMTLDKLPDADTVIAQESLQTPDAVKTFKSNLEQTKAQLTEEINNLPNQTVIDDYKARIDDIKANSKDGNKLLGLLSQGKEIKQLRDDIKADLNRVKRLKNQLSSAQSQITKDFAILKQMPEKDWQRLKSKYALSGNGVNEIVSSLFGDQIGRWAQTAWHYYEIASPYMNSYQSVDSDSEVKVAQQITSRGRQVLFEDTNPLPNFLLKKINVSSSLQDYGLAISGVIENLTTEPDRWKQPMTLALEGQSAQLKSFNIRGTLDHRNPDQSSDVINLNAIGLVLNALAQENESDFVINDGTVDINADIQRQGDRIDSTLYLTFKALDISSKLQDDWQKQLLTAVNALASISVTVKLTGEIANPDIAISSNDLNKIGTALIQSMASNEMAKFEAQLQSAVNQQTAGLLEEAGSLADISGLLEQLNLRESNLSELLKLSR